MTATDALRSSTPARVSAAKLVSPETATDISAAASMHCSDQCERAASVRTFENDDDDATLQRVATTGPAKRCVEFPAERLRFSSCFDGGSMQSVAHVATDTFHVAVAEDAAASGVSTGYTTWFYFELETLPIATAALGHDSEGSDDITEPMREHAAGRGVRLVLTNMNGQKGLYSNGYTVMYCAVDAATLAARGVSSSGDSDVERMFDNEKLWRRLPAPLTFEKYTVPVVPHASGSDDNDTDDVDANDITAQETTARSATRTPPTYTSAPKPKQELKVKLSFTHRFQFVHERVRFAFCYPHSYSRLQRQLAALDAQFASSSPTHSQQHQQQQQVANSRIYYHRELLTRSIEGLRVDLLTISSCDALTGRRDAPLDGVHLPPPPPGTAASSHTERAFAFDPQQKRTVLISARVHPAETPASYMLGGMLDLLLHPTDAGAIALRHYFVFKIVPMLNPDGVCQGFYRTDTRGVNLNRVYEAPSRECAPAVFAIKALLLQIVGVYGGVGSEQAARSVVYLDLHAHANRRGCFVYGNNLLECTSSGRAKQIETQLFARLVALHTPYFDYLACSFDKANMSRHDARDNGTATTSREGCSRVALFKATGLTFVYTIECNYNEGRRNLRHSTAALSLPASSSLTPALHRVSSSASSNAARSATSASPSALVRHVALSSGTRLYMKYSPAEWIDVGIGSLVALLDLFQLPGRSKTVQESPFRSLDGIRKSLWTEIKSAELGVSSSQPSNSSSGSGSKDAKERSKSTIAITALKTTRRPSSKM